MSGRPALLLALLCCHLTFAGEAAPADAGTRGKAKTVKKTGPGSCPTKREDAKPDARCTVTPDEVCSFAGGAWCACRATSCVSAAGPLGDCQATLRWVCRDDGCPAVPAGACPTEGQQCAYDDGRCASMVECRGGTWSAGQPTCRPAAPPVGSPAEPRRSNWPPRGDRSRPGARPGRAG